MKKGKIVIIVLGVILCFLLAAGTYVYFFVPVSLGGQYAQGLEALPADTLLTADRVAADRDYAIQFVEDVHPYFVLEEDQSVYEKARQNYIDATSAAMSVGDFQAATGEYLCAFGDGHTRIRWNEEEYIPLEQVYRDGNSYRVVDGEVTDIQITDIGGVDMETIYAAIDCIFPAENDMAVAVNRNNRITGRNILELAGVDIIDNSVRVDYSDGSAEIYSFCRPEETTEENREEVKNTWHMEEDIFVVDFIECVDDENLQAIATELENAVKQGCNKVIIDARGNGGGNSNACERLLHAMGMEVPQYSMVIRYSPEAKEQLGYLRKSGSFRWEGSSKNAKTNEAVNLVVLCDRYTFSSATMLCVFVRDGHLGTIIGEPSSNMPSCYGDILYLSLPESHVFASVSHKQFIRPDGDNTERMLVPDIQTDAEEAYEEAVAFLNEKD